MNEQQRKRLDHLLELAHDSPKHFRSKIVAMVVKRNNNISYGFNQRKTHTFQVQYNKNYHAVFVHAEIDAIKNALRKISVNDLSKCDLYVARSKYEEGKKEVLLPGLAKPCVGCQKAIVAFGFKNVFYTS